MQTEESLINLKNFICVIIRAKDVFRMLMQSCRLFSKEKKIQGPRERCSSLEILDKISILDSLKKKKNTEIIYSGVMSFEL